MGTEGLKKHVSEKHQSVAVASAAAQVQQAHQASLAASVAAATAAASKRAAAGQQSNLKLEVVFKCEFCSGTFSQQSSLNQHIRSFHMELQCVVCGSALVGSESMIAHIQESHQPSKMMANPGGLLFHCEVCETSFAKSSAYDEHFLNEHVFCKVGNELVKPDLTPIPLGGATVAANGNGGADTPTSSSKLQQHQAAAAGANLNIVYQCEHCDGMFTDADSLAKHIDTAHPEAFRIAAAAAAAAAATTASSS